MVPAPSFESSAFTSISQVAVLPLAVVAVTDAVPSLMAVTLPFSSTVTMLGSLELQVTSALVAFAGLTVAFKVVVASG